MTGATAVPVLAVEAPRPSVRDQGGVLLIACYELGRQPLSLAWPLAHLRRAGIAPAVVDTAVDTLDDADLRRARLIAVATPMHTAMRLAIPILERARQVNPGACRLVFGLYAVLNADYLRRDGLVDVVLGPDPDDELLSVIEQLASGVPLDRPPLVSGPVAGGSGRVPRLRRVDLPVPYRAALPAPDRYARLVWRGEERLAGSAETTRGCRHTCRHCPLTPVYQGRFVAVPVATVLDDIRQQVEAGVRHITFGDPDFLNGPTHAVRVARAMRAEFADVTFDATIKIEHILRQHRIVAELADLGCIFVVSAVESRNDEVLRRLNKGHSRADINAALAVLDAAGVAMRPSLLAFTPWTTATDYLDVVDWVLAEGLEEYVDPVHFAIRLLVPPGSALLADPDSAGFFGDLDAANLTHVWRHPDPRMDDLQCDVAALVTAAASEGHPPGATLAAIRARAARLVDVAPPAPSRRRCRPQPPRLTESWFC
jgi:hypothetical protein